MSKLTIEEIAMNIVGNAGEARSLTFEALKKAREKKFDEATELLNQAKQRSLQAHELQTELICSEADGEKVEINLLMVHAQDHLMNSILARELVEEMIEIYKKI